MASNITPLANQIDALYPIAGRENSSQGFRDNFLNIKTALTTASDEITFLQNDGVFKSASDNDMSASSISNVILRNVGLSAVPEQQIAGLLTPIYYNAGSYQEFQIGSDTTFVLQNVRESGIYSNVRIKIIGHVDNHISFAGISGSTTVIWSDASLPYRFQGNWATVWDLWTADGGQTVFVTQVGSTFTARS